MINKQIDLSSAGQLIQDGQSIALGGNSIHRFPGSFVRELARQKKKKLTLIKTAGAYDVDLLCLSQSVKAVHAGFVGFESEFGLAQNYRAAVEAGTVQALEHACYTVIAGLRAAAFGIPFMPFASLGKSDLLRVRNFLVQKDPFGSGKEVVLVQRLRPDWAIIHAQEADLEGNASIIGPHYEDLLMSRAARAVIITTERIVKSSCFQKKPDAVHIPGFLVHSVVESPKGAFPGSCFGEYDYDSHAIRHYLSLQSKDLPEYLEEVK
ncbi:CoA transferase subunit A [Heliorestis convoluta]|uniref:CoA transferase subunit A n=1 Tax=Heliorestis convoluta TaxID=356322 RepID=A0A5Q2MXT8_9FIRM|nr:CoA-transferase [Heliorestis convoluta]QGG47624.1 CoA transferase subunit A [Heliorestis convoluta]